MAVARVKLVQIKGIREGLLVTIGDGEWAEAQQALIAQIEEQAAFFKGARIAIDIGKRILHAAEMGSLRDKLSGCGLSLWAVISHSPVSEQTAKTLGLATRLTATRAERTTVSSKPALTGEEAVIYQKSLRSGQRVAAGSHVVIVGDVNPGAEIIATGSVIVWGRLRGSVHAGAEGDATAMVCGLEIDPTLLRIASYFYTLTNKKKKHGPEIARIKNDQVVLEPWNLK